MARHKLPKGIHRVKRKHVNGTAKWHFYAGRGGPSSGKARERYPSDTACFAAMAKALKRPEPEHYMTPAMAKIIDATAPDQILILTNASGNPLTGRHANEMLRYYRDKAGLAEKTLGYSLRLQDCRGTAATRLLHASLSLSEIASQTGWSVRYASSVIEHYACVSPDETDGILAKLVMVRARPS